MNNKKLNGKFKLMLKDKPVLTYEDSFDKVTILCDDLLPYALRAKLINVSKDNSSSFIVTSLHNSEAMLKWCEERTMDADRVFARNLAFAVMGYPHTGHKLCYKYHAASLTDAYWIKHESESNLKWEDVDMHRLEFDPRLTEASLFGKVTTKLDNAGVSPDLTNKGTSPKAWVHQHGDTYLIKRSYAGCGSVEKEIMVSNLLDKLSVSHVKYQPSAYKKENNEIEKMCQCKCFTSDKVMFVPAKDYQEFCYACGKDFILECLMIDEQTLYQMLAVDFLIANPNRHAGNYGFLVDMETNKPIKMAPLYDHCRAFDQQCMHDVNWPSSTFKERTMYELGRAGAIKSGLKIVKTIHEDDFENEEQYICFRNRAQMLNIW